MRLTAWRCGSHKAPCGNTGPVVRTGRSLVLWSISQHCLSYRRGSGGAVTVFGYQLSSSKHSRGPPSVGDSRKSESFTSDLAHRPRRYGLFRTSSDSRWNVRICRGKNKNPRRAIVLDGDVLDQFQLPRRVVRSFAAEFGSRHLWIWSSIVGVRRVAALLES